MKKVLVFCLASLSLVIACKEQQKNTVEKVETVEKLKSIPEQVAIANGFANWATVNKITFTFNVDRGDSHFERTWSWAPKTNDVVFMTREDTIAYNRKAVDTVLAKTDAGFINDKFWLLAPYQLVWDKNGYRYEHEATATAPMSQEPMQKLTIVYGSEGGYTPGDAYDFYFGDDFIIKEWAFRKGNQEAPNMVTSWEDYKDFKGLNIATKHKRADEDFNLYFTGITVE
ncbi:hypothetical protein ACFQZJ_17920 [Maribacter chungangensis]|uniref:Uncharacterized protein n=1 Tax=Maribacter chungangensis TaxID=1069117 RepID=A0ABW3B9C1_9FLAO